MLRKKRMILSILCVLLTPILGAAAGTSSQEPEIFLPESTYEFQSVVEGSQVVHDFVLRNRGDALLAILDIKSG